MGVEVGAFLQNKYTCAVETDRATKQLALAIT